MFIVHKGWYRYLYPVRLHIFDFNDIDIEKFEKNLYWYYSQVISNYLIINYTH